MFVFVPPLHMRDGPNLQDSVQLPQLPAEIWNIIFSFLELEDRCIASSVCRAWYTYAWVCITTHTLSLRQRMFQDQIISNIICKSKLLRHLKLIDCFCLTPAVLGHLPPQLQSLEIINCPHFTRSCRVNHFEHLPNLHSLELPNCAHLDISQLLPFLPRSLKSLNVKGCKMLDGSSPSFQQLKQSLPNLTQLNLSFVQIDTGMDDVLANLPPTLEELVCRGITLTNSSFQNLPLGLKVLDIAMSKGLQTCHLEQLSRLPSLRKLNLDGCMLESVVVEAFGQLPNSLQHLSLRECYPITDATLLHLPQWLQNLNLALCNSNKQAGEGAKITSWSNLPTTLLTLNLAGCSVSDENCTMMLPNLEWLSLFATQITGAGLKNIPSNVVELDLSWCGIADDALFLLADSNVFCKLKCLNLSNTKLSSDGYAWLQAQRPNVCILGGSRLE